MDLLKFSKCIKIRKQIIGLQSNQVTCKINSAQETSLKVAKGKELSKIVSELSSIAIQSCRKSDILNLLWSNLTTDRQDFFLHLI